MPAVARIGDTSDHGGSIISGSDNVSADGIPVARVGDVHTCPISGHGTTAIVSTPQNSVYNGVLVATVGAKTGCGATIVSGSPTVNAGSGSN